MAADNPIWVEAAGVRLATDLVVPARPAGVVLFAHGSGSSRLSPRNRQVAARLNEQGLATLLADLLTPEEEQRDAATGELRFDIGLLAIRTAALVDWAAATEPVRRRPVGLFGASTGAAAALVAAAERPAVVRAVVSRGGRPDLAGTALARVRAPVLLVVGERDGQVVRLNEQAAAALTAPYQVHVVPGATHLFAEPGALSEVADRAAAWFGTHLR
jgi:dienelactone hydrolase